jgi:hypothetical protein
MTIKFLQILRFNFFFFSFSYDTEALNKQLLDPFMNIFGEDEQSCTNTFGDSSHEKITLGVQQLYIIGKKYLTVFHFM